MEWFLMALKKFVDFSGRARRKEYWMYTLFVVLIGLVAMAIDAAMGNYPNGFPIFNTITSLFFFLPSLAVTARRLHDIGKSGVWILIVFIPLIGAIWLLVYMFQDSQPGENKWGPNPKGIENQEII